MSAFNKTQATHRSPARVWIAGLLCIAVFLAIGMVRMSLGTHPAAPSDVVDVLVGGGRPSLRFQILDDRLPSWAAAVLSGAGLAVSGGLFQRLLGNPLASPDIIGVGYGATAATVIGLLIFSLTGAALTVFALAGALLTVTIILGLSALAPGQTGVGKRLGDRMILAGIALGAMLLATVQYVLSRAQLRSAGEALHWLSGDVTNLSWTDLGGLAACLVFLFICVWVLHLRLGVMELGDDTAQALGVRPQLIRVSVVAIGAALTAVVVAVVGPLAFVALMSHPIALRVVGGRGNLVVTALVGATVVAASDLLAAHLFGLSAGVPAGVVSGAFGAPFLLWLLAKKNPGGQ
jgi:iron complex transport system permease protein